MSESFQQNQVDEQRKRFYLKIGVGLFSVLIAALWLFSLRFSVSANLNDLIVEDNNQTAVWQEDLNESMNALKANLKNSQVEDIQIKTEEKVFLQTMSANLAELTSAQEMSDESELIVEEKLGSEMLLELESRLNSQCPAYINCMPMIGEARPCVIPPGCENITQIAY